jgi:hypothetical protein
VTKNEKVELLLVGGDFFLIPAVIVTALRGRLYWK